MFDIAAYPIDNDETNRQGLIRMTVQVFCLGKASKFTINSKTRILFLIVDLR